MTVYGLGFRVAHRAGSSDYRSLVLLCCGTIVCFVLRVLTPTIRTSGREASVVGSAGEAHKLISIT